ncbi:hypothetical protein BDW66DRAFT_169584 [Aspergillus desertorum]
MHFLEFPRPTFIPCHPGSLIAPSVSDYPHSFVNAMSWSTSSPLTTVLDGSGLSETVEIMTITPPNTFSGTTTRTIFTGSTVDVYSTWNATISTMTTITTTITRASATDSRTGSAATNATTATTTTTTSSPSTPSGSDTGTQTTRTTSVSSASNTTMANNASTHTPDISSSSHSSSGVSTGAMAGAIVGSIIGSALLTMLLAFLFSRRQKPRPSQEPESDDSSAAGYGKAGVTVTTREKSVAPFSLASIVPQPADDETVRRHILTLIDQISLHADNYYRQNRSVDASHLAPDVVAQLAKYEWEGLPAPVVTMLGQNLIQRQVITHVLVRTLLQAILPGGRLLPILLAAQPQLDTSTPSTATALFTWRMLTSHLYNQSNYTKDPSHTAARARAAHDLAVEFTSVFFPYASAFTESDRVAHLESVARSTAELGIWLFAQPCTFEFIWVESANEFSVVPRVTKVCDEEGKRLVKPQILVEGEQVRYRS